MLCDYKVTLWVLVHLEEPQDVGMVHLLEDLYLLKEAYLFLTSEESLLDDLNSTFGARFSMSCLPYFAECSRAEYFPYLVVISDVVGPVLENERLLRKHDVLDVVDHFILALS